MYAATRGDGVWRSEDAGETWQKPNRGKPRAGQGQVRDHRSPEPRHSLRRLRADWRSGSLMTGGRRGRPSTAYWTCLASVRSTTLCAPSSPTFTT